MFLSNYILISNLYKLFKHISYITNILIIQETMSFTVLLFFLSSDFSFHLKRFFDLILFYFIHLFSIFTIINHDILSFCCLAYYCAFSISKPLFINNFSAFTFSKPLFFNNYCAFTISKPLFFLSNTLVHSPSVNHFFFQQL